MVSLTKGNVKAAFKTLSRNKGRSMLTMLGVIIGVASVVTVVSVGEGVKQQVNAQTDRLGKDLITIRPGRLLSGTDRQTLSSLGPLPGVGVGGTLTSKDVGTVAKTPGVAKVVPLSVVNGSVTSEETKDRSSALVIGTTKALPDILNQGIAYGAFWDSDASSMDKVVIGARVVQDLYNENVPLGQTLTILGHQFIVIGILNEFQTAPLSMDADFNNAVFISSDAADQITNNNAPLYEILARPTDPAQTAVVAQGLRASLSAAHGGQHDTTVLEQAQTLAVTDTILDLLTALIGGVAAISLLVGGIGIMNVMLVSVTERMHEIGIRKAVGATNRQILSQFITEAAVLSISGGVIGIAVSLAVTIGLRLFTTLTPVIDWQIVALACVVSVGVGVVFGSIPALQAARKDPIAALRNE